jgi:hypothetical protein
MGSRRRGAAPALLALTLQIVSHIHNHSVWNAIVRGWIEHLDPKRFSRSIPHRRVKDDESCLGRGRVSTQRGRAIGRNGQGHLDAG